MAESYQEYQKVRTEKYRQKTDYSERFTQLLQMDVYGQLKQIWRFITQQKSEIRD